ncbi:hypothetical protein [Salinimicrobium xinjiangense]|uniref:hypothetical protein n=1 Tax=Salinimicrobium xinjiangense TaxID=438596 RepID=UPI0004298AC2|nr:hypothetical protein [Salinimicrobium xinjiangense]
MKKLVLCLLLFGFLSSGHSQILLDEAKVDYRKESMRLDPNTNSLEIEIPEKTVGEFQRDPLAFMKNSFDIQQFIADNEESGYHSYQVNFISNKGFLVARFNQSGELVSSFQKFKDVRLPENARLQILEKYRDAAILGNRYVASTKGWDIHKAYFKVKVRDAEGIQRLRINKDRELLSLTGL